MSRTVFLGTSSFAATVLGRVASTQHRPTLVLTPPDRPRGRGRHLEPPPAARRAAELGIPVLKTANVNEPSTLAALRAGRPSLAVVCAFGQLIREPLLSEVLMLNIHPSLLPRWRGAAPIERTIMAGDELSGVSILRVTKGLDSGPIALQERTEVRPGEDYGSLSERLAELGGELIVRALELAEEGSLHFSEQDDAKTTYAEKIDPTERRLSPGREAAELERVVRALAPHIGAYLELEGGERLGVREARAEDGRLGLGEIEAREGELRLGCAEGVLCLLSVQPPGGREMRSEDYLRGHPPPSRAATS